jgi:arylsulfatase A-like enzyme
MRQDSVDKKRGVVIALSLTAVLAVVAVYLLFFASNDGTPPPDTGDKYNVLLIVSDALRHDVLSCYGGEARTPHIDQLAQNGALFENAYCTSPWTPPSSVSMFTGNYATSYGYGKYLRTIQVYVPQSETLFAEILSDSGYATGMMIETHQASLHDNMQGFEEIPQLVPSSNPETKALMDSICAVTGAYFYDRDDCKNLFGVLRNLLELSPEENFYTAYWMLDPHVPLRPLDKFKSRIKVDGDKLRHHRSVYEYGVQEDKTYNDEEIEYIRKLYIAEVETVDERIGFIIKMLEHKNLLDKTYIVFTSDHGEFFGEHDFYGHGRYYYEGLVNVPLLIAGPGIGKGKRIKDFVSHVDLTPTLKDLLGVEYEDRMMGKSYKSLLLASLKREGILYFDDVREHQFKDALREGNYKLICRADGAFELYDISTDPEESNNLASSRPELVRSMLAKLEAIREKIAGRRQENLAAVYENVDRRSPAEKRRIMRQLKSLGYLK